MPSIACSQLSQEQGRHYLLNEQNPTPNLIPAGHTFPKGDFTEGKLTRPRLEVQFPYGSFTFAQREREKHTHATTQQHPEPETLLQSSARSVPSTGSTDSGGRSQREGRSEGQSPLEALPHVGISEMERGHTGVGLQIIFRE